VRIAVVIPYYDDPRLAQALASVAAQTRPADEVIVVDDGSPRPPVALGKVTVLTTPRPQCGPAIARNIGVRAATADAIAFLDADDLFLPTKLERQADAMERTGAAWSYTDCRYLGSRGVFRRPNSWFHGWPGALPSGRAIHEAHLQGHNFITMSSVMVRRAVCPVFDPALPVSEDWDAFVRLAEAHDGVAVNEVLHLYRLHPAGGRHYRALADYERVNLSILRAAHERADLPAGRFQEAADRVRQRAAIQHLNAGRGRDARHLLEDQWSARSLALGLLSYSPPAYRLALRFWCGDWV